MAFSKERMKEIYHRKVELLIFGLRIGKNFHDSAHKFGIEFNRGRKGGAGPAGGRYFLFKNDSVVNVPLWGSESEKSHLVLNKIIEEDENRKGYLYCQIKNENSGKEYTNLRLIPIPEGYNNEGNLDGTINKQIALVHGTSCLASTIVQRCKYWKEGTKCSFCGIELSLKDGGTIEKKSGKHLIKAIKNAMEKGLCEHITLTSGTLDSPDKGAINYIKVVKEIKTRFPDLPIHIQIEPFDRLEYLEEMKNSGVDTIGVHLELINDELRKKICPGKFNIPKTEFEVFWKKAVEIFGKAQVSSFILIGFDEKLPELIEYIDKIASIGVIPFIVPVRTIPRTKLIKNPANLQEILKIYDSVSEILIKYDLNPFDNKAGCIKCGGCSALFDAYSYRKHL